MSFDLKKLNKNKTLFQHSPLEVHLELSERLQWQQRKDLLNENEYKGYKTNTPK